MYGNGTPPRVPIGSVQRHEIQETTDPAPSFGSEVGAIVPHDSVAPEPPDDSLSRITVERKSLKFRASVRVTGGKITSAPNSKMTISLPEGTDETVAGNLCKIITEIVKRKRTSVKLKTIARTERGIK